MACLAGARCRSVIVRSTRRDPGWGQPAASALRRLICAVADGRFDAYVDFDVDRPVGLPRGSWSVRSPAWRWRTFDRPLVTLDHAARRPWWLELAKRSSPWSLLGGESDR